MRVLGNPEEFNLEGHVEGNGEGIVLLLLTRFQTQQRQHVAVLTRESPGGDLSGTYKGAYFQVPEAHVDTRAYSAQVLKSFAVVEMANEPPAGQVEITLKKSE